MSKELEGLILSVTKRLANKGEEMPLSEILADLSVAQAEIKKHVKNLDPVKDKTDIESWLSVNEMLKVEEVAARDRIKQKRNIVKKKQALTSRKWMTFKLKQFNQKLKK